MYGILEQLPYSKYLDSFSITIIKCWDTLNSLVTKFVQVDLLPNDLFRAVDKREYLVIIRDKFVNSD